MNQTQRKFLIERIQTKVKAAIEGLKATRLEYPSSSNYIFKAILNDNLELQPTEVIMKALKEKALKAKEGKNWLNSNNSSWMSHKETTVALEINSLIIVPNDYKKEFERVQAFNAKINEDIAALNLQLDSIEVRVQLASDKTLKQLINDVDDMGDIRLIDANLKLLN